MRDFGVARGRSQLPLVFWLCLVVWWAPGAAPKLGNLPAPSCSYNKRLGIRVCLRAEVIPWDMRCIVHVIGGQPVGCRSTSGEGAASRVLFVLRAKALRDVSVPTAAAAWRLLDGTAKPWLQRWAGAWKSVEGALPMSSKRGLPFEACAVRMGSTLMCVEAVADGLSSRTLAVGDTAELLAAAGMRACARLLGIAGEGNNAGGRRLRSASVFLGVMTLRAPSRQVLQGLSFELRSIENPTERWRARLRPFQFLTGEERELVQRDAEPATGAGDLLGGHQQQPSAAVVVLRSVPVLSGISNAAMIVAADAVRAAVLASSARLLGNRSADAGAKWTSLNASPMVGSDLGDLLPSLDRSDTYWEGTNPRRDHLAFAPSVDDSACRADSWDRARCHWALASLVDSAPLTVAPGGNGPHSSTIRAAMAAADAWVAASVSQMGPDSAAHGTRDTLTLPAACRLSFGRRGGATATWHCSPEPGTPSLEFDRLCTASSVLIIAEATTENWPQWRRAPLAALVDHCGTLANVSATLLVVIVTDASRFYPVTDMDSGSPDALVLATAASLRPSSKARGLAGAMLAKCPGGQADRLGLVVHPRVEWDWLAHCEMGQGRACGAARGVARKASMLLQQLSQRGKAQVVCARMAADTAASPPGVIAAMQASTEERLVGTTVSWVNDSLTGIQAEARVYGQGVPLSAAVLEHARQCAGGTACGLDISYAMAASRDAWLAEMSLVAAGNTFSSMDNLVATRRAARALSKWCPRLSSTQLALAALLKGARLTDASGCRRAAKTIAGMRRLNTNHADHCAGRSPFPTSLIRDACGCNLQQEIDKLEQLTAPLFVDVDAKD